MIDKTDHSYFLFVPPYHPIHSQLIFFILNNTVISLKCGNMCRLLLNVCWWFSLVWKEMCSNFNTDIASNDPGLPTQGQWNGTYGKMLLDFYLFIYFGHKLGHWRKEMECCTDQRKLGISQESRTKISLK